jgi:hypothetical protein
VDGPDVDGAASDFYLSGWTEWNQISATMTDNRVKLIRSSQGSEVPAVVTPLAMQQYMLLQRNLVWPGITRGRKLVVLIRQRKALCVAVRNNRAENRFEGLLARLRVGGGRNPDSILHRVERATSLQ